MILNSKQITEQIDAVKEVAGYLWERGWAERNAGNISINLTGLADVSAIKLDDSKYIKADIPSDAANTLLFITGTGERLRDLRNKCESAACILLIDAKAEGYYIVWGGQTDGFRPTSEFISHISIHLANDKAKNGHRCVVHTHPIELIAISHHPELGSDEQRLNKALWSMLPEIRVFVPRGIAVTSYLLPGSKELADISVERLLDKDVILWSKHGALATGKDALQAFDFIDVANKGALIYMKCLQTGFVPVGMTDDELKGLEVFL